MVWLQITLLLKKSSKNFIYLLPTIKMDNEPSTLSSLWDSKTCASFSAIFSTMVSTESFWRLETGILIGACRPFCANLINTSLSKSGENFSLILWITDSKPWMIKGRLSFSKIFSSFSFNWIMYICEFELQISF